MSLKNRSLGKDFRRLSLDLTANLHHALRKLCKEKPIRLSQLKIEYDYYFKDRISTKPPELVAAALKSLENDVLAVKVYVQVDNREMTDVLLGLRNASYSAHMCDEDNPLLSKERLLNIIKESDALGIQVRELEKRYVDFYGTRPSYLPYKSIKELLHRTADVELASSGKNLRVRTRQVLMPSRKSQTTRIPALSRSSMTSSLRARKPPDFMTLSVCRISDSRLRGCSDDSEMSASLAVTSQLSPDDSPTSSSSGSPNGSVDMSVSMVLPRDFRGGFCADRVGRKTAAVSAKTEAEVALQSKEVMATILNDFPAEGMSLKGLTDEFLSILGPDYPLGMTTVEFLTKEFRDVVKLEEDESGLRVFKMNSPLLPRRTIADVYTKLALQSNRRPSDRVLKVLKNIYRKRNPEAGAVEPAPVPVPSTPPTQPTSLQRPHTLPTPLKLATPATPTTPMPPLLTPLTPLTPSTPTLTSTPPPSSATDALRTAIANPTAKHDDKQKAVIKELHHKLASAASKQSRVPVRTQHRSKQNVIDDVKGRLQNGHIEYPSEFLELTKHFNGDTQSLLVDLMSSLNLCLKPQDGKMVLQMS